MADFVHGERNVIDLDGQDTPEVALWRAVITQAIADATMQIRPPKEFNRKGIRKSNRELQKVMAANKRERDEARDWLIKDSKGFRDICEMALLEPDAVRERALSLASRGWPSQKPASRFEDRTGDAA